MSINDGCYKVGRMGKTSPLNFQAKHMKAREVKAHGEYKERQKETSDIDRNYKKLKRELNQLRARCKW
jgi:hypothetical protein